MNYHNKDNYHFNDLSEAFCNVAWQWSSVHSINTYISILFLINIMEHLLCVNIMVGFIMAVENINRWNMAGFSTILNILTILIIK